MTTPRKKHTIQTKVKVALEAIKGEKTTSEIMSRYGIHSTQVNNWKNQALKILPDAFSGKIKKRDDDQQGLIDELYKQIGQLKVENDFLKKNIDFSS
jgi:transposase-like protein